MPRGVRASACWSNKDIKSTHGARASETAANLVLCLVQQQLELALIPSKAGFAAQRKISKRFIAARAAAPGGCLRACQHKLLARFQMA